MPYNPTGLGRPMGATSQSGLPPNRRPQTPGIGATGPLNLAGPPKMPSPQTGVNTSRPMGMPVAPPMLGGSRMPVAPDGMTRPGGQGMAPPPMMAPPPGGGTEVGFGGGRFGTDMLLGPGASPPVLPPGTSNQTFGFVGGGNPMSQFGLGSGPGGGRNPLLPPQRFGPGGAFTR